MPTPKDSTITVRFRASGDRALKRAIEELHLAQVRLEKGTKAYDKAVRQLKLDKERLNNEFGLGVKNSRLLSNSFATLRSKLLLVSFGAGIAAATVGRLTKLFAEQEAAEKRLSTALGFVSQELLNFASAMQEVTTFGDEVTISAMATAAAFTKNEDAIKQMTIAAQNMSIATGKDLNTSMELISKSIFSTTDALSRYGIVIAKSNSLSEKFNNTLKGVNDKYSGQARAAVNTYAGATKQLSNSMGDLGESLGEVLAEALLPLIKAMTALSAVLQPIAPIFGLLTKAVLSFAASVYLTTARLKAMITWIGVTTASMLKLDAAGKKTAVSMSRLKRAFIAFIVIEGAIRLFSKFSNKTKDLNQETVEIAGSIKDLDMIMAGLVRKSDLEGYLSKVQSLSKESSKAVAESVKKLNALGYQSSQVSTAAMADIDAQLDKLKEGFQAEFPFSRGKSENELLRLMNQFTSRSGMFGAKAGENYYRAYQRIAQPKILMRNFLELTKEEESAMKDLEVVENKLRQIRINNIAWTESIVPNMEKQNKLLHAQNTLSGTALEIEKMKIEAEARGVDPEQFNEQFANMQREIKLRTKLTNTKKKDLFITNSFNKAMVDGINNNWRFAESFGNMIKKMAAELLAHMATFILFKSLIPGGGQMNMFQYAIGKLTGQSLTTTSTFTGLPVPTTQGAMQGIALESQNAAMQGGSVSIVVNFSGNVLSQDFIENEAIPQIKQAIRRGADIGVS